MDSSLGEVKWILDVDTRSGEAKLKKFRGDINETTGEAETSTGRMGGAWKTLGKTIAGAAIGAGVAITTAIIANLDDAIRRVDTLNNADRVFANMGFAASDTEQAMDDLDQSIRGLPTSLDTAVRGVQILAGTIGDVEQSQEVFSALNNAIIGFGGTAVEVDGAIRQLSQLPLDGPLDAQTWNSLRQNGLTPVFNALAKDSGVSMGELRRQFSEGELDVQDFLDRLVKLNKEGGGGLVSLEQIARDATSGIETGFANMNTAITRGIGEVIEAIGAENISGFISDVGKAFEDTLKAVADAIGFAITVIQGLIEWLQPLFDWIGQNEEALNLLKTTFAVLGGILLGVIVAAIIAVVVAFTVVVAIFQYVIDVVMDVMEFFIALGGVIASVASDAWQSIQRAFGAIGQWFTDRFNEAVNGIRQAFSGVSGFFQDVWNNVVNTFNSLSRSIGRIIGNVVQFFRDLPGNILRALGDFGNFLFNVGRDMIQGLINGIRDFAGNVAETIQNVARDALEGFKNFFGISSPSKVMAAQGEFLMQGLTKGIEDASDDAVRAVDDVNSEIARHMATGASTFDSDITGRMETSSAASGMIDGFNARTSEGATVNQTNNFYQSDDPNMEKVNSDLTWQLGKL